MTIIPAIDIIDGKCVRLTKGDFATVKVYNADPLEVAKQFEAAGLSRLHLVDLDGAKTGFVKNWKTLEQIAKETSLIIDFSGGLSSAQLIQTAFDAGAYYVSIGSMAVKNEAMFLECLAANEVRRFILAIDVRDEKVQINGWSQMSEIPLLELISKYEQKGIRQFICTDINRDGLLGGPSVDLYENILKAHPDIDLIASGGVSSAVDIGAVFRVGCKAVIIGKAIYENRIQLETLKRLEWMLAC